MFYRTYQPLAALSPYVQSLYLVVSPPQPDTVRKPWPDSGVALVFGFGAPLFIAADSRLRQAPPIYRIAISARQRERTFAAPSGLAPKGLARAIRFERLREALWQGERSDLTTLALCYGHADQSRLTRNLRAFPGLSAIPLTRALRADFAFLRGLNTAFLQESAES